MQFLIKKIRVFGFSLFTNKSSVSLVITEIINFSKSTYGFNELLPIRLVGEHR